MICTWAAGRENPALVGGERPQHTSFSLGSIACFICYIEKETPIFTLLGLLDKKLFL